MSTSELYALNLRQIYRGIASRSEYEIASACDDLGRSGYMPDIDDEDIAVYLAALDLRIVPSRVRIYDSSRVEALFVLARKFIESALDDEILSDTDEVDEACPDITEDVHRKAIQAMRRSDFARRRPELVLQLQERDRYACKACGAETNLTVDHIVPLSKGGTDDLGNLQFLCARCNSSKGARLEAPSRRPTPDSRERPAL